MPTITPKITPFLWFNTNAEEAVKFYTAIFPNSRIGDISRYTFDTPSNLPRGTVLTINFTLAGQPFTALNGGPMYTFTEAVSFVVHCDTQAELDAYWDKLLAGGGAPQACGWLKDRFGLSWQVVPADIFELISGPQSARVMQAVMEMVKLDIAKLRAAAAGK
jgi:predicted 3-demethylubiquinone-9 3-methyltransferase (glyoxalase superfamily)